MVVKAEIRKIAGNIVRRDLFLMAKANLLELWCSVETSQFSRKQRLITCSRKELLQRASLKKKANGIGQRPLDTHQNGNTCKDRKVRTQEEPKGNYKRTVRKSRIA